MDWNLSWWRPAVALFAVLGLASPALGQLSNDDRKCIAEVNLGGRKVGLIQNKAVQSCVRFFSKGTLSGTLDDCVPEGSPAKVTINVNKALAKAEKLCGDTTPPLGPQATDEHPAVAIQNAFDMLEDVFGPPPLDSTFSTDRDIGKCQSTILKDLHKCHDGRMKEFGKCISNGIKFGQISSTADIETQCLNADMQNEPLKKVLANCITKPVKHIASSCVKKDVALDTAFPGCATSDADELGACVNTAARCAVCSFAVDVDLLTTDCDLYDDDAANGSCATPPACGNGTVLAPETCDDGNRIAGDGCDASCQSESGFNCSPSGGACTSICGDSLAVSGETCDDGNTTAGDGCDASCQIESGYSCATPGSPCAPICGDSIQTGGETCDDGNTTAGDGCDASCQVEGGFSCPTPGSACDGICGDGLIRGTEACDDGGTNTNDGCNASCQLEAGFSCNGEPTSCAEVCGDSLQVGTESCDDGNTTPGDGCDASCGIESGYACTTPGSACTTICGDGLIRGTEACDDGDSDSGNGCSASCEVELGWVCSGEASTCNEFTVVIATPVHGSFTTAMLIDITGQVNYLDPGDASLTINGTPVVVQFDGSFSAQINSDVDAIFNPVEAAVTQASTGAIAYDRNVAIYGPPVADGDVSHESVALRLNDSGLDQAEGLVASLAGSGLDLATLIPVGTKIIEDECFFSLFGCVARGDVTISNPPPSFANFGIEMDSQTGTVDGDITVHDIQVDVLLSGSGLTPTCGIRIQSSSASFDGTYALQPDASNASKVDVNQSGSLAVSFQSFSNSFTSGTCTWPIIGDIIAGLLPDVEALTQSAMSDFLNDPDGAGPDDGPIADAIEDALSEIDISGAIAGGLGVQLETPLFDVTEDTAGITIGTDSAFTASIGNDGGQCPAVPGAPDLLASLNVDQPFPSFGATTPISGEGYDLGLCISSSGFNQLLKAQIECGLLVSSITEVDLSGTGTPTPLNTAILATFIPALAAYPPTTPVRIDITPTMAPVVAGDGPDGELTQLLIAQVLVDIVVLDGMSDVVVLTLAFDATLGMDLAFGETALGITLSEPDLANIEIAIVYAPLGANVALIESLLPSLISGLIPDLASALAEFPLPEFLGLELDGVEVSKNGEFLSLFGNLVEPTP